MASSIDIRAFFLSARMRTMSMSLDSFCGSGAGLPSDPFHPQVLDRSVVVFGPGLMGMD